MRHGGNITDVASTDAYARWLERNRSHDELVLEVERVFREKGPAMPRRLRLDLGEFLRERSAAQLAHCVAMNDDPRDDVAFRDAPSPRR